jgi:hypothetical protein
VRVSPPIHIPARWRRPPPTLLERLVGRPRARAIRRRLGFVAIGAGVTLLRPRYPWKPALVSAGFVVLAVLAVR